MEGEISVFGLSTVMTVTVIKQLSVGETSLI